jgi:hypothetical protein
MTEIQLRPAGVALKIPKLYISGFPKSGLHLAQRMAFGMFEQNNPDKNWLGTNAWTSKHYKLDRLGTQFIKLKSGQFLKGHIGHLPAIEFLMIMMEIGVVFVYRDLRDVVVSQYYHIMDKEIGEDGRDKFMHPDKETYWDLGNKEDIMIAIIEGVNDDLPGIFERFESYVGWLDSEWAMTISYEVLMRNQLLAANKFFDYVYDTAMKISEVSGLLDTRSSVRQTTVQGILTEMRWMPSQSPTFRKGVIGNWKQEFTPKVTEKFKELDPGFLVRLGYERDDTWQ